jgi:hypothetical protein
MFDGLSPHQITLLANMFIRITVNQEQAIIVQVFQYLLIYAQIKVQHTEMASCRD